MEAPSRGLSDMVPMRMALQESETQSDSKNLISHISKQRKSDGSHKLTPKYDKKPINLRYLVHEATERAEKSNSLVPIRNSHAEIFSENDMTFALSYMHDSELRSRASSNRNSYDPFGADHLDPMLLVSTIPPMHTLVLNKFPSITDHVILITNRFKPQNSLLTYDDMEAWMWCVVRLEAFGFYNSDSNAGSSQHHKHMQLIPRDQIYSFSGIEILPVETVIYPLIQSGEWLFYDPLRHSSNTYRVPQYNFEHGVLVLMNEAEWDSTEDKRYSYNEYLMSAYHELLRVTGTLPYSEDKHKRHLEENTPPESYNLLLTERWMMIVRRSRESYDGMVSVNGIGFVGMLLAKNESSLAHIKSVGPLRVLSAVAHPLS